MIISAVTQTQTASEIAFPSSIGGLGNSLVAPQRPTRPGIGVTAESQTVPPAIVPLDGTFLIRLIMESAPREAGKQLRERREGRVGQLLFQVVKREKEHGPLTLGSHGGRGGQQDGEGQDGEQGVPDLGAQCRAGKDTLTLSIC